MRHTRSNPVRRAVTLVELLVVISIMLLLAAVAVPAMRPMMEGRRIREAARAINVYLSSARSEAMRTGRPVGIMLQRLKGQPECSMVIDQAEMPPTYAGDSMDAKVRVQTVNRATGEVRIYVQAGVFTDGLVRTFDRIRFDQQGPWYWLANGPDSSAPGTPNHYYYDFANGTDIDGDQFIDDPCYLTATLTWATSLGGTPPWPDAPPSPPRSTDASHPVSFEIQRMPVKSNAKPLQLPAGAVVDLAASGTDRVRFWPWPTSTHPAPPPIQDFASVCIMFSPSGAVHRLYTYTDWWRDSSGQIETRMGVDPNPDPIFLLVGRRERVADFITSPLPGTPTAEEKPNWADMGNLWVTLNPQTGLVSVAENSQVNATENPVGDLNCDPNNDLGTAPAFSWSDPTSWNAAIWRTRQYARQAQSVGGR